MWCFMTIGVAMVMLVFEWQVSFLIVLFFVLWRSVCVDWFVCIIFVVALFLLSDICDLIVTCLVWWLRIVTIVILFLFLVCINVICDALSSWLILFMTVVNMMVGMVALVMSVVIWCRVVCSLVSCCCLLCVLLLVIEVVMRLVNGWIWCLMLVGNGFLLCVVTIIMFYSWLCMMIGESNALRILWRLVRLVMIFLVVG